MRLRGVGTNQRYAAGLQRKGFNREAAAHDLVPPSLSEAAVRGASPERFVAPAAARQGRHVSASWCWLGPWLALPTRNSATRTLSR